MPPTMRCTSTLLASCLQPALLPARSASASPRAPKQSSTQSRSCSSSSYSIRAQARPPAPGSRPAPSLSAVRVRLLSTSTSPAPTADSAPAAPTASATATASASDPPPPQPHLTWARFLHLRAIRRRFEMGASVLTGATTMAGGAWFLSEQDLETLAGYLFGMEPVLALGLSTVACGAGGWLIGPFAGGAAFNVWFRRFGAEIALKEKDFYTRIKRLRVNPSGQSMNNPVPDYYGEKINSIAAYRNWLKDQRAFTKKRYMF